MMRTCSVCELDKNEDEYRISPRRRSASKGFELYNYMLAKCRKCETLAVREQVLNLKNQIYDHYGRECTCCGEKRTDFLTLDHILGDGAEHRKEIGSTNKKSNTTAVHRWIVKNNFPSDFQVLCFNCNCSKGVGEYCIHKLEKTAETLLAA